MALVATAFGASAQQTLEQATDSVRQIYLRAQQGVAADQNEVGGWFYRGRHVPQSYETALQWWSRAAQQGNAQAIGNMGLCYQTGHGIPADSLRATQLYDRSLREGNPQLFESLEAQAQQGSLFAATYMAHCYKAGIGTRKNVDKEMEYLQIAANKGSVVSRTQLGLLQYNKHDYIQAFNNFNMAAQAGDLSATYFTGLLLLEGKGVGQNATEGVNYLMRAERRGHPRAMYRLGLCYLNGEGVVRNPEQAFKLFTQAAGKGLEIAQWQVAECYLKGIGTEVSYNRATYYFSRTLAGRGGETKFSRYLTDSISGTPYYDYLQGTKAYFAHNYQEAMDYYKQLARTDRAEGDFLQGVVLSTPQYSKANPKKGLKAIKKAAETNPAAMYMLAVMYEQGDGVDRNMEEAVRLYTESADKGFGASECNLGDIYFEGRGVERNYDEAVRYYLAAAESGQLNSSAATRLAECYEQGLGGLTVDTAAAAALREGNYDSRRDQLLRMI